ncbi:alpha-hydroxy-acid oxidizing enzyme [Marmoricola endophyticus]|uniref:Alpha-hydroxy-acid oxidizing enzyme n=1 Tax=Marmoricola endophyticus TaxID=2040280 RepID=A0A917BBF0_9ACTN|nr:alpha-hydroxy-acid oxidizing protein [Marmoricola endophyticus]GGF35400.1 alpha-hydroxy-acid oxidizing enzyme [Marmoricola endophyticus]
MSGRWLDEIEQLAREALPPSVHRYITQGARDGVVTGEATAAWRAVRLLPRVLHDVTDVDLRTTLLGTEVAAPVAVAPTTLQRAAHPDGEMAMAAAVRDEHGLMVVSSNAGTPFAEIGGTGVAWWLQAYLTQDRDLCRPMLEAAAAHGARAVVLTLDTPVVGTKYDDGSPTVWDDVDVSFNRLNLGPAATAPKATDLGSDDLAWVGEVSGLPVVAKGVLRPDDARRCASSGAAAVWVSNHGGRQLDRAAATASCLAPVAAALGSTSTEVYVDGGLRSGLDVLCALAAGARSVFLGRLPLLALAAGGPDGVRRCLADVSEELEESLRLAGYAGLTGLSDLIAPV